MRSCDFWCAHTDCNAEVVCVWQERSVVVNTEWNHVPLCWMTQQEWAQLEDRAFFYQAVHPSLLFGCFFFLLACCLAFAFQSQMTVMEFSLNKRFLLPVCKSHARATSCLSELVMQIRESVQSILWQTTYVWMSPLKNSLKGVLS